VGVLTYYSDESVRVTSLAIQVNGRSYPLGELVRVWHRPAGPQARRLMTRGALALAPLAPLVAGAGVAALGLRLDSPATRVTMLVLAALLALATVPLLDLALGGVERTYDRGTRTHELWARWRGHEVLLVRTGDRTRFGRIYRAVQRALEATTHRR
jgi:hypothetical protein